MKKGRLNTQIVVGFQIFDKGTIVDILKEGETYYQCYCSGWEVGIEKDYVDIIDDNLNITYANSSVIYANPSDYNFSLIYTNPKVGENNSKNKIMNIKEKFILAITPEPKRSFRKAGITNGDDMLTDEGVKIFLTWLLYNKFADEFKKEVVDEMLKEEKK